MFVHIKMIAKAVQFLIDFLSYETKVYDSARVSKTRTAFKTVVIKSK